jgi:hypothetical protein
VVAPVTAVFRYQRQLDIFIMQSFELFDMRLQFWQNSLGNRQPRYIKSPTAFIKGV